MCFPPKGTLTLTPGMGMGGGWVGGWGVGGIITKDHKKCFVRKLFTLLGHFRNNVKTHLQNIFIYTENYTEAEKRIAKKQFTIHNTPKIQKYISRNRNVSNISPK